MTTHNVLYVRNAVKRFPMRTDGRTDKELAVFHGIDLDLRVGEFVSLLGPSGCGKSTLINILAGQDTLDGGVVRKGGSGQDRTELRLAVVWQQDSLMPWKSARKNIEFPLAILGTPPRERKDIARAWLRAVGLGDFENYYPSQLSQGMRQRVSLAAALAVRPNLLLMDEPFGALDAYSKLQIEKEVVRLWEEMDASILMVTHDVQEAIALSDRIIMLTGRPARVAFDRQIDLPRPRNLDEIYGAPRFHTLVSELWNALTKPR
uniref:NitT/TauT family transport system ATP-binding protein n=1 Tax=Candidatus Kentrum sp. TC TaxID=2126339 RepID=A0A450YPG0_9GAMM|nr:MAG: NitT/TauT family transport system ATP-binding protein [Candidatus Kentron sp. TC]VFK44798.1 MAG: NitT/TauT family transport system ATP-binding protein [Candidatus Kentron sp. TC]VFK58179.1 MAG: NitT/TauT family transport system ATP-binding protein [Candidatus Kentron sp. TC]